MQVALMSNTNIAPLSYSLKKYSSITDVFVSGYGEYINDLVEAASPLSLFHPDVVFLYLDGSELLTDTEHDLDFSKHPLFDQISFITDALINFLTANKPCVALISTIFFRPYYCLTHMDRNTTTSYSLFERKINESLESLARFNSNIYLVDVNRLIMLHGYKNLFDDKYWNLGRIRFNDYGTNELSNQIISLYKGVIGDSKKVLVIDLDNTIWGGVLGEDGLSGIQLSEDGIGKAYRDFQKSLKSIQSLGVILCINSKNNRDDVKFAFDNHPMMVLKYSDFVVRKINWNDKFTNMMELSYELGLGLESFVFLDDNPVEREMIRSSSPEVAVPDFPNDAFNLQEWFINDLIYLYFPRVSTTKEDTEKTRQYSRNVARIHTSKKMDMNSFLQSLKMSIAVQKNTKTLVGRVAQLTSKTNQFNVAKRPYSVAQIEQFVEKQNSCVYAIGYEDKFGYEGIIGAAIIEINNNVAHIDSLMISCRVIGRGVEYAFMSTLLNDLKHKVGLVSVNYRQTDNNEMVRPYLENCGLSLTDNNYYEGELEKTLMHIPATHIEIHVRHE